MSTFIVPVFEITKIEKHGNADTLSIITIGGFKAIVRTGDFKEGDKAVYIPEGSIVPPRILEEMNLVGKLGGKDFNRVKAVKLRGILSQGLVYPCKEGWVIGQDVQNELGIVKYEPELPTQLRGLVFQVPSTHSLRYDVENYKHYMKVVEYLEANKIMVKFTEKLHGTLGLYTLVSDSMAAQLRNAPKTFLVSSKGMAGKNLSIIEETKNLYWSVANKYNIEEKMRRVFSHLLAENKIVQLVGEIIGPAVQDLRYAQKVEFRIFDISISNDDLSKTFVNADKLKEYSDLLELPTVPHLYTGVFSMEEMLNHTDGKETVSGKEFHIREGIVVTPLVEMNSDEISTFGRPLGRVILKSVSEAYYLRKNATEYT